MTKRRIPQVQSRSYGLPSYRGMFIRSKVDDPYLPPLALVYEATGADPIHETRSIEQAFTWIDAYRDDETELPRTDDEVGPDP